jgi:hypothetical protein
MSRAPLGVDLRAAALFGLPRTNLRDTLRVRHFQSRLRARVVVEVGTVTLGRRLLMARSIARMFDSSSGATMVNADPVSSARAVRPTRWM